MSSAIREVAFPVVPSCNTPLSPEDPWYDLDPDQQHWDDIAFHANDETASDASIRERQEASEAKVRTRLNRPASARGAYRSLAIKDSKLPHARFRVLAYHLDAGDPDLSNSFTGRRTAARELGMALPTYDKHMSGLRSDGYIQVQEFQHNGRQASSAIQFCLPGRVFFSGVEWTGPTRWDKRTSGEPKRNRNHDRPLITQ